LGTRNPEKRTTEPGIWNQEPGKARRRNLVFGNPEPGKARRRNLVFGTRNPEKRTAEPGIGNQEPGKENGGIRNREARDSGSRYWQLRPVRFSEQGLKPEIRNLKSEI
jgi:hypothetical protein